MAKIYKSIPYIERMESPKYKCSVCCSSREPLYHVEERVVDEKSQRVVTRSKFTSKPSLKSYRVNDFCLENLQALGVPLNPATLHHDINTSMSMMEDFTTSLEKSIVNQKTE